MATWQLNTFYVLNFFIPSLHERISSVFFYRYLQFGTIISKDPQNKKFVCLAHNSYIQTTTLKLLVPVNI
jgi:hypothetical protein